MARGSRDSGGGRVPGAADNVPGERGRDTFFPRLARPRRTPRPVIPVGAAEPLARPLLTAQRYHGEDGLGDLPDWPETEKPPLEPDAVSAIVEHARRVERPAAALAARPLAKPAPTPQSHPGARGPAAPLPARG